MSSPGFTLSAKELDLLWSELGIASRIPYPLEVPGTGRTVPERARLVDEAYAGLAERGLASGRELDPDLAELLLLLGHHQVAIDAVGFLQYPYRALAAAGAGRAVLAVFVHDELEFTEIRPTALAMGIVGVLPPAEAGPGQAMSVPFRAVAAAADPPEDVYGDEMEERDVLTGAGVSDRDADALLELAQRRRAGGQFGVTTGAGERMPTLVTWFDTDLGRYLMVREDSWLSIGPADNARIEQRVAKVLSEVDERGYHGVL